MLPVRSLPRVRAVSHLGSISRRSLSSSSVKLSESKSPMSQPNNETLGPLLRVNDPWVLPGLSNHLNIRYSGSPRFSMHVLKGEYERAWEVLESLIDKDPATLSKIDTKHISKLLALIPRTLRRLQSWWPKVAKLKRALDQEKIALTSMDYTILIKIAFRARDYHAVEDLWQEADSKGMGDDVELWNAYITATCQAYPMFWPVQQGFSEWQTLSASNPPPLSNDILKLLQYMDIRGTTPNARTYELVVLAFGAQGKLDVCRQIIDQSWLNDERDITPSSLLWPHVSTLTAVIDAFSYNDRAEEAIDLIGKIQSKYDIKLNDPEALIMWNRLLQWIHALSEPRGRLATSMFYEVWEAMVNKYNVVPDSGLWTTRIKYLNVKNQFDKIAKDLDQIYVPGDRKAELVATSALTKCIKGLTNTSRALDALSLMEKWAHKGIDLREDLEAYVKRRGGGVTKEQLHMYQEDDDEDNIIGLN